jgi:hypothetical protein
VNGGDAFFSVQSSRVIRIDRLFTKLSVRDNRSRSSHHLFFSTCLSSTLLVAGTSMSYALDIRPQRSQIELFDFFCSQDCISCDITGGIQVNTLVDGSKTLKTTQIGDRAHGVSHIKNEFIISRLKGRKWTTGKIFQLI